MITFNLVIDSSFKARFLQFEGSNKLVKDYNFISSEGIISMNITCEPEVRENLEKVLADWDSLSIPKPFWRSLFSISRNMTYLNVSFDKWYVQLRSEARYIYGKEASQIFSDKNKKDHEHLFLSGYTPEKAVAKYHRKKPPTVDLV